MITETHQCPCCNALLSADQMDARNCPACGAGNLAQLINTKGTNEGLQQEKRRFIEGFIRENVPYNTGFNRGFGQF